MKKYINIIVIILLLSSINNSCTDRFDEINTSRRLVIRELVDINMMFTKVMVDAVLNYEDGFGQTGNYAGMSVSGANIPFQTGESNGIWNATYGNYATNLSDIIHICTIREKPEELINKKSIARIMKVWAFARCTDVYGDIPYFESCLPVEEAVTTPKYDLQKDIYADFFKELKEAVAEMDDSKPSFGDADIMFNGDLEKWKKFANSLRLRLALRVRYADEAMAKAQMADLNENNLITDSSDDAFVTNITDYPYHENDLYTDLVSRGATVIKGDVGKTFLDILKDNNDPRLPVFCDSVTAFFPNNPEYHYQKYRGRPLLSNTNTQAGYAYGLSTCSKWSDLHWVQIREYPLYRSSETYFILAEAALFNIKSGDAQAYFKKGIEIAMAEAKKMYDDAVPQLPKVVSLFMSGKSQSEVDAAVVRIISDKKIIQDSVDDFLANSSAVVLTGTSEQKLEQIMNQKLIAFFPQEQEAWSEQRRTGYPRILVENEYRRALPRRMPWPGNEQLTNFDQYSIALERIGGAGKDERSTNIWWLANPDPFKLHPSEVETRTAPWSTY